MTKTELITVVNDLRDGKTFPDVDTSPLYGLGLDDFPKRRTVRREVISNFLNWQCMFLDGTIDEEELDNCMFLLKKKVVMI